MITLNFLGMLTCHPTLAGYGKCFEPDASHTGRLKRGPLRERGSAPSRQASTPVVKRTGIPWLFPVSKWAKRWLCSVCQQPALGSEALENLYSVWTKMIRCPTAANFCTGNR